MKTRGFTLIELLVALTLVAVALAALARATQASIDTEADLRVRLVARWIAENRLEEHYARRDWPNPGTTEGRVEMGGMEFFWRETIGGTPNPRFRRIEIAVGRLGQEQPSARLTGALFVQ